MRTRPAFSAADVSDATSEVFRSGAMSGESYVGDRCRTILEPCDNNRAGRSELADLPNQRTKRHIYNGSRGLRSVETHHTRRKSDQGLRGGPYPGGSGAGDFA